MLSAPRRLQEPLRREEGNARNNNPDVDASYKACRLPQWGSDIANDAPSQIDLHTADHWVQAANLGAAALTGWVGCELPYLPPLAFLPRLLPWYQKGADTMRGKMFSRRRFMATSAAASTTMIAAPFVKTAYAAGKLSIGFWDHFVPDANKTSDALIQEWAAKEKVEVQVDRFTGNKALITLAAEAQAKSGHDILYMTSWLPHAYASSLEPVDDVMTQLIKQNGPVNDIVAYLGRAKSRWLAVPATIGNQIQGPCSRIDLMKQYAVIDVQAMYPAGAPPKADNWTLDTFLKAAEACHKAGFPFGIGLGTTEDSVVAAGVIFQCFGAVLVDADGKITVKSDTVRQALDYYTRLARFFPPDAPAWDNTSNNKWLISGRGALILNPPSAWAVAKRDAPQIAEQLWTHGMPSGPKGRFAPCLPFFW